MLAAGMVMGPSGFRGKHYSDPLSVYPGWIPLFRDKDEIPAGALNYATSERKHLLPCIASFDLSDMSGPVRMLSRDGSMRDVATPAARKRKDDIAILIRAPLPLTLLSEHQLSLIRRQSRHLKATPRTFPMSICPLIGSEVAESLFSTVMDVTWPPVQLQGQLLEADADDNPPTLGQALGGVFAMLYQTANRSDLGLAAFRLVTGAARDKDSDSGPKRPHTGRATRLDG